MVDILNISYLNNCLIAYNIGIKVIYSYVYLKINIQDHLKLEIL